MAELARPGGGLTRPDSSAPAPARQLRVRAAGGLGVRGVPRRLWAVPSPRPLRFPARPPPVGGVSSRNSSSEGGTSGLDFCGSSLSQPSLGMGITSAIAVAVKLGVWGGTDPPSASQSCLSTLEAAGHPPYVCAVAKRSRPGLEPAATVWCLEAGLFLAGEMAGPQVLRTLGCGAWLPTLLGAHLSLTRVPPRGGTVWGCVSVYPGERGLDLEALALCWERSSNPHWGLPGRGDSRMKLAFQVWPS